MSPNFSTHTFSLVVFLHSCINFHCFWRGVIKISGCTVWLLLWVTRGAPNPNLQIAIAALAPHVCSYSLIWTSTENEWIASPAIWSHAFGPSVTCNLITHVLTIYHVKLESVLTFDRCHPHSNCWLLLVYRGRQCKKFDVFGSMGTIMIESPWGAFQWYNIML